MITVHTGILVHILNCTTKYLVPVMSRGTRYQVQQLVQMVMLVSDMQTFMIRCWLCTRC